MSTHPHPDSKTLKTSDAFLYLPAAHAAPAISTIIFFITGNPGLISYYHEFLTLLCRPSSDDATPSDRNPNSTPQSDLDGTQHAAPVSDRDRKAVVAGFSLGGFELDDPTPSGQAGLDSSDAEMLRRLAYPTAFTEKKGVYGLRDQIALCYARVDALVKYVCSFYHEGVGGQSAGARQPNRVNVVLMGHSVGAYIALELVRMHYQRECLRAEGMKRETNEEDDGANADSGVPFDIVSAVLLTPTIVDIARSSSGRIATPLLSYFPGFPWIVQLASSGLASLLSRQKLRWLVSRVTGMKDGSDALEATVGFLIKSGCVRQALQMAGDEMSEIGEGRWGEEVWGVLKQAENSKQERWRAPQLYFWFAKNDHWVADVTREELVSISRNYFADDRIAVESRYGRPEIVIDEDEGLVHAWCIEQSVTVARRVERWVEQSLTFVR